MPLTLADLEGLAPDQAALVAARKLLTPRHWPLLACEGELLWGHCQGSGATPYRVVFDGSDRGSKCTCPSRKFPCKHVLALAWLWLERSADFGGEERPDWVLDWLARRRRTGATRTPEAEPQTAPQASLALLPDETYESDGNHTSARGAVARERNRERREAATLDSLDDLDRWIGDLLRRGVLSAAGDIAVTVRTMVRRLADAKATSLATRIEELPLRLNGYSENERPLQLLAELGELHLIAAAYRRSGALPAGLAADARRAVGWPDRREDLHSDPEALQRNGRFTVMAQRAVLQADRLLRRETWLAAVEAEPHTTRFALLLDFVPAASRAAHGQSNAAFEIGEQLEGKLRFFPSAAPLRADFLDPGPRLLPGARYESDLPVAGTTLAPALAEIDALRTQLPWCGARAFYADGCRVIQARTGEFWLVDEHRALGLPLAEEQRELLWPLLGCSPFTAFGIVGGGVIELGLAATELGQWRAG